MAKAPRARKANSLSPAPNKSGVFWPAMLIVCATVIAYWPALSGEFIWNDSDYVTAPHLRSLDGLWCLWTEPGAVEQYYPLLHSAFWIQFRLFGENPFGYHIVTVLLHAGSALLFGLIVRRLFGEDAAIPADSVQRRHAGAGWLAALLFALHPVHVESVAWITEQKNTLSLLLYLAAALAYLRFDETRRGKLYGIATVLFVASLACKTVTATLPAALLVVFWWKRGTLEWKRDIRPLLPWLVLGAAAGLFSSWVEQHHLGAKGEDFSLSAAGRTLVAGRAVWFYAGKLVWPSGLNFIYPRWVIDPGIWWQWLFPAGVLAVGVALWMARTRRRGPLAAFLFFIGSLFPVLGFVNLFGARYSWVWDHWQYLPNLGLLALAAAGLTAGARYGAARFQWFRPALLGLLAVLLGGLTWNHSRIFHDDETLFRATLARNPGCWMAHNNLGLIWSRQPGRQAEAIAAFQASLQLEPDNVAAHQNLGNALAQVPGRLGEAIAAFETVLRLQPDNLEVHNNLGNALAMTGRPGDAMIHFQAVLRLQPDHAPAHSNLGNILMQMGRLDEAVSSYETSLRLQPGNEAGWFNLGICRADQGNFPAAMAAFREVLRLSPGNRPAQEALSAVQAMATHR